MYSKKKKIKPYRVLSLDGGGMRGLYTASVLKTLSERFCGTGKKDIGKAFDLICGTSTGGILATGLAAGVEIEKIIDLYMEKGKDIFVNPIPQENCKKLRWLICNFKSAANSNSSLQKTLRDIFGEETIGGMYQERKVGLCVQALRLVNYSPVVFKTPHNRAKNADNSRSLTDICLATSAAPLILPTASISSPGYPAIQEHFIDGGLWANNPTLIGLIEALELTKENQKIEIISIGTCPPSRGDIPDKNKINRGIIEWNFGVDIFEASGNAQSRSVEFICNFLEKNLNNAGRNISIYRLPQTNMSPDQEKVVKFDNPSQEACDTLVTLGSNDGKYIHGKICNKSEEKLNILKDIFVNLPDLNTEERK